MQTKTPDQAEGKAQKRTRQYEQPVTGRDAEERTKILLFAGAWIMIVAAIVVILTPRGTPLQNCRSALLAENKEQCLYQLALSSGNSSLCGSLSSIDSDSCYFTIAEANENVSLCIDITDQNRSAQCTEFVANTTNNVGYCYPLHQGFRDTCINTMALKDYNVSLCSKLSNYTNRSVCSSSIYFADALRLKNQTYCSSVPVSYDPDVVSSVLLDSGALNYANVGSNLSGYITLLAFSSTIPNQFSTRDFCYFAYAAEYADSSACLSVTNSSLESSCAYITAPKMSSSNNASAVNYTQLISDCSIETSGAANQTACVFLIKTSEALGEKNVSLCGTITGEYSYECYASFASQFMNASYCNYIKNYTVYTACVQDVYYNASAAANGTSAYP